MASNMYISLTDAKGEVIVADQKDSIEVISWSHAFSQPTSPTRVSAGSGTVERASHTDFSFVKYTDASTQSLIKFCWTGKQVAKAIFSAYRADGNEDNSKLKYLEVTMEEVVISNVSVGGGAGDISTENVSLNYGVITYKYVQQKKSDGTAEGNFSVTHDLKSNKVS